jgi:hypothetical protein
MQLKYYKFRKYNSIDKKFTIYIHFELEILYVYYILHVNIMSELVQTKIDIQKNSEKSNTNKRYHMKTQSNSKYLTFY